MTRVPQTTDSMVIDHFAEFLLLPTDVLSSFYADDRLGYVDAVNKMLQLLATSERLRLPDRLKKEESVRLGEKLRRANRSDDSPEFGSDVNARKADALAWTAAKWPVIDESLKKDQLVLDAITGHVRREFRQCFLLPAQDRFSTADYVEKENAKQLSTATRNHLKRSVQDLVGQSSLSWDACSDWLDQTITTHYRNFAWYALFYLSDYTPSLTRSHLPLLETATESASREAQVRHAIVRCIAVDMLEGVDTRTELLDRALEWCDSQKGARVRKGFLDLRDRLAFSSESERQEILDDVNAVLGSATGYYMGLSLGTAEVFRDVAGLREPEGNVAMRLHPSLRWLYDIRQPGTVHKLFKLVDGLVRRPEI